MGIPIYLVDAFATEPFSGNPAGVCLLRQQKHEEWMQNMALELKAPATAFVLLGTEPLQLRWFTPATELALCGHATLAAAHILWEEGQRYATTPLRFMTKSGHLSAERRANLIELNFPSEPPTPVPEPPGLLAALGVRSARYIGRNKFDLLVELEDGAAVRGVRPNMSALADVNARGVMVTARSQGEFDFLSRFFAPAIGVPEDAVTGSAHCCLGPYWMSKLGRSDLRAYQASSRGGVIRITVEGDRTKLGGEAVTVIRAVFDPEMYHS